MTFNADDYDMDKMIGQLGVEKIDRIKAITLDSIMATILSRLDEDISNCNVADALVIAVERRFMMTIAENAQTLACALIVAEATGDDVMDILKDNEEVVFIERDTVM